MNYIYRLLVVSALILLPNSILAIENDYPKTLKERKIDEMGSVLGGEGLVFRPSKVKNQSTKATITDTHVNKYLWQAALDILKDMPLMNVDSTSGTIITEWYSNKNMPKYSYKVSVFIKDEVISPEALHVSVFEKTEKSKEPTEAKDLEASFEDKILRKAREIYISSERK
jgi:hypothetical protein